MSALAYVGFCVLICVTGYLWGWRDGHATGWMKCYYDHIRPERATQRVIGRIGKLLEKLNATA